MELEQFKNMSKEYCSIEMILKKIYSELLECKNAEEMESVEYKLYEILFSRCSKMIKRTDYDYEKYLLRKGMDFHLPRIQMLKKFFVIDCRGLYAKDEYTSESKKVYLDLGVDNFYNLINEIFELYYEVYKEVKCKNLKGKLVEKLGQFKMKYHYSNDAVVFRILNNGQYKIFKEQLAHSPKILSSLQINNLFVPTDSIEGHEFGVVQDAGGSYNGYVFDLIKFYLKECLNKKQEPSLDEFLSFLKEKYNDVLSNCYRADDIFFDEPTDLEKNIRLKYNDYMIDAVSKEKIKIK